jgi:hypothetical protein
MDMVAVALVDTSTWMVRMADEAARLANGRWCGVAKADFRRIYGLPRRKLVNHNEQRESEGMANHVKTICCVRNIVTPGIGICRVGDWYGLRTLIA